MINDIMTKNLRTEGILVSWAHLQMFIETVPLIFCPYLTIKWLKYDMFLEILSSKPTDALLISHSIYIRDLTKSNNVHTSITFCTEISQVLPKSVPRFMINLSN